MDILRKGFDGFYDLIKPAVFRMTDKDPEVAHRLFVNSLKVLDVSGLSGLVLDNSANRLNPGYDISNAAGFNKNGDINPKVMRSLGFDRVVIGTVTADCWGGNPEPRMKRFPETKTLVNWMGLPGVGAEGVAKQLRVYGYHGVPLTVNLMSTPGKKGMDVLNDLSHTTYTMKNVPYVDRFELNISCPNTHGSDGSIDARKENLSQLDKMLEIVDSSISHNQELYLKVSPDSSEDDIDDIVSIAEKYDVRGYTVGNTTTNHDSRYVTEEMSMGGGSGDVVYSPSVVTQKSFADRVGKDVKLIACGGISSVERANERREIGNCNEIQIFTPLIFEGTELLRKLRTG